MKKFLPDGFHIGSVLATFFWDNHRILDSLYESLRTFADVQVVDDRVLPARASPMLSPRPTEKKLLIIQQSSSPLQSQNLLVLMNSKELDSICKNNRT